MQIGWDEVRGWAGLVLSYAAAIGTAGLLLWRAFIHKINEVTESLRKDAKTTAESCIAHGVRLGEHERRLIVAEGENKIAVTSLAEINVHLERIERGVEALRRDMNIEDKLVAGRLSAVEAGLDMLLKKEGFK